MNWDCQADVLYIILDFNGDLQLNAHGLPVVVVEGGGDRKGMEGIEVGIEGILGRNGMVGIEDKGGKENIGIVGIVGIEGLTVGLVGIEGVVGMFGMVGIAGIVGYGVAWRRRRLLAAEHISLPIRAKNATIKVEKKRVEEAMTSLS